MLWHKRERLGIATELFEVKLVGNVLAKSSVLVEGIQLTVQPPDETKGGKRRQSNVRFNILCIFMQSVRDMKKIQKIITFSEEK